MKKRCVRSVTSTYSCTPRGTGITSGRALKALLADGVTTGDWSFEGNLERLRREEDPRYGLARAVAEALRTGDTSALDDFEEWRDLDLPDREE